MDIKDANATTAAITAKIGDRPECPHCGNFALGIRYCSVPLITPHYDIDLETDIIQGPIKFEQSDVQFVVLTCFRCGHMMAFDPEIFESETT